MKRRCILTTSFLFAMQRLLINTTSLYFGMLCFWLSNKTSHIWQSDRNLILKGLGLLDEPIIAFIFGVLTAFALLTRLFLVKTPHTLLLTFIAPILLVLTSFGTLMLSQGKLEGLNTSQLHIYYVVYIFIFHILTGLLPKISSWHILQRPLLVLSIPLTLLAMLPIQNVLISSLGERTRNNLAQNFFGYDIDGGKQSIYNCQQFINTYEPILSLEFDSKSEVTASKRYRKMNGLIYNFSNPNGNGNIIIRALSLKQSLSYQLQVSTPFQVEIDVPLSTNSPIPDPRPTNRLAMTGPNGPTYIYNIDCR